MSKPKVPTALVATLFAAALVAAAGCGQKSKSIPASEASSNAPSGEAARTQELEQKADDYQSRMQAIQSSDMSADEKAQAASALVDEQQRTIQQSAEPAPADSNGNPPN